MQIMFIRDSNKNQKLESDGLDNVLMNYRPQQYYTIGINFTI